MLLENVQVGDHVTRILGHTVEMTLVVGSVGPELIKCGSLDGIVSWEEGWTFRKDNGYEVDKSLGWDGIKKTGSYIKL